MLGPETEDLRAATDSDFRKALTGLDTSLVQLSDDQERSTIETGCPEEAALMIQLETLLEEQQVMTRWKTFKATSVYTELPLWCLRARSHKVNLAAELLPKVIGMMEELEIGGGDQKQLQADLESKAIIGTDTKDAHGRALIWMRSRYVDPKRSSASDIARLFATTLLNALRDTSVQRNGCVLLIDATRQGMRNITPATVNAIYRTVMPNLPISLAFVFIINPTWFVANIMWPVVATFFSRKVRQNHILIYGARKELWAARLAQFDVPHTSLPVDLGGSAHVDCAACVAFFGKLSEK